MVFKKILLGISALAAALLWASGCYYDDSVLVGLEETREISFAQDMLPLFDQHCNSSGCHNTGGIPPDLSADKAYNALTNGNYVDLEAPESSELYQWMTGNRSSPMPLSGPDAKLNAIVLAWIKQGARNN